MKIDLLYDTHLSYVYDRHNYGDDLISIVIENNKTFTNNFKKIDMEKAKTIVKIAGVFLLLFSYGNISGNNDLSGG